MVSLRLPGVDASGDRVGRSGGVLAVMHHLSWRQVEFCRWSLLAAGSPEPVVWALDFAAHFALGELVANGTDT